MLSRRELIAGHTQPPEVGLYVTRQRGVAAERTSHLLQDLPDLDQHQLLLAHHPKNAREGGATERLLPESRRRP
jgi:hypothetical protein